MSKWRCVVVLSACALAFGPGQATAQGSYDPSRALSAAHILPACQEKETESKWSQGICIGQIQMLYLLAFGDGLGPKAKFCPPDGVTINQARAVVIKYIGDRPEQMHLPFVFLALDALQKAWPCGSN